MSPGTAVAALGLSMACLALAFAGSTATAAERLEIPIELQAYRVHLAVALGPGAKSKLALAEVLDATRQAARRCVGSCWNLTVTEADWLQPASPASLSRLSVQDLAAQAHQSVDDMDVWLAATVQEDGPGFHISVRSWQPALEIPSESAEETAFDRRDIPLTLLKSCHSAFRPIGVIDEVDGKTVKVLLQAGAISVPDPEFGLVRKIRYFVPVLASRNRDLKIEKTQLIPWTYLSAGDFQGTRLQCELQSGLRSPVGGKQRGRVITYAVGVRATNESTRLDLGTQSRPSLPLVANRIEVRSAPEIPDPENLPEKDDRLRHVLLTDRRGQVTIPADGNDLVWLFAYSGRQLQARVPLLPGVVRRVQLEVPDDSARLAAESNLYSLQGQLIEAVAARTTVIARIRAALKKNDLSSAKSAQLELIKLPSADVYLERVIAIRVPAAKAAKARKDRAGEARINRMCDEMSDLIKQHLSEDKRQIVLEELKEHHLFDSEADGMPPPAETPAPGGKDAPSE